MMKKTISLFAVAICMLVSMPARGAVAWAFNSSFANGTTSFAPTTTDAQAANANLTVQNNTSTSYVTPGFNSSAGALGIDGNKNVQNATVLNISFTAGAGNNLTSFQLSYNYNRSSGSSPTAIVWSFYINDQQQGLSISETLTGAGWQTQSAFNLAGLAASPTDLVRISGSLSGASSSGALVSFDNVSFNFSSTPVPEPTTYAMALFGLIFIGGGVGRFYLGKSRQKA